MRGIANAVIPFLGSEGSNPSLSARKALRASARGAFCLSLLAVLLCASCADRTVTYRTTPPGAEVYIAGERIGHTPLTTPLVHGGPRTVIFVLGAYEPLELVHDSHDFWLDTPGVDLLASLAGSEQHLEVHAELTPSGLAARIENDEASVLGRIRSRAETLRERARDLFLRSPPAPGEDDSAPLELPEDPPLNDR